MSIELLSHLGAAAAYGLLTLLLAVSWHRRRITLLLTLAAGFTALWALTVAGTRPLSLPLVLAQLAELGRDLFWCLVLVRILRQRATASELPTRRCDRWQGELLALAAADLLLLLASAFAADALPAWMLVEAPLVGWLIFSLAGLLLIEQLYRNADPHERWALKHLCLGLGSLFAFDFYLYSEALLFKQIDLELWQARGFVDALAVPLIAVSAARNESWTRGIHVSRQVVFHSLTLLLAGAYLLVMASAGYFIRRYGGSWGGVLQAAFFMAAALLLLILLFSDTLRARIRVLLSKHFFSHKYDYRQEWARFTRTLAQGEEPVPERAVRAVAALVDSRGGLVWMKRGERFELAGQWGMDAPDPLPVIEAEDPLVRFLEESGWVVDLTEYSATPSLYQELRLPAWIEGIPHAWLVVPLALGEALKGFLIIRHSLARSKINWEDRDLLKMAARQAAAHLAQHEADQALVQARQFEAFNRLSAYIVHDLKNILAQQSLIVSNAEKHKHNPAFVDDVIDTVRNSVERMTRLMEQMRSGMRGSRPAVLDLGRLLQEVAQRRAAHRPPPRLETAGEPLCAEADREQLATVFGHLVQNAQEATPDDGRVTLRLFREGERAIIEVEDTGVGMDAAFIKERLFKPFDSTKGLTGMGIGVFESREYLRAIGGELQVRSMPGKGTLFRVLLPLRPCGGEETGEPRNEE